MRSYDNSMRACMIRCMNVDEAREVCRDRSSWYSAVLPNPMGKGVSQSHLLRIEIVVS